jgi:hypothetical protein
MSKELTAKSIIALTNEIVENIPPPVYQLPIHRRKITKVVLKFPLLHKFASLNDLKSVRGLGSSKSNKRVSLLLWLWWWW